LETILPLGKSPARHPGKNPSDAHDYVTSEKLEKNAIWIISLFGSTYVCEKMFSRMKHVKNKIRSSIADGHLEQCMCLATASLEPDIDFPVREKQSQVAH